MPRKRKTPKEGQASTSTNTNTTSTNTNTTTTTNNNRASEQLVVNGGEGGSISHSLIAQQLGGLSILPPASIEEVRNQGPIINPLPESINSTELANPIGAAPPASSSSVNFPARPGKGTVGTRCTVKANHFLAQLPTKDIYHYDVTITPEVKSRGFNKGVMQQLVTLYRNSALGQRLPVYDGRKSLYTAGSLPFQIKEFTVNLQDEGDSSKTSRKQQFKVVIKFAARADLHHLGQFLSGKQRDAPQEALQALDIVLRELPTNIYTSIGRSFYSPNLGRCQQLGEGLDSWKGFYQSLRPTEMGPSLNIDISTHAFIEPLIVTEFVNKLLNKDTKYLSEADRKKVRQALYEVKIEVTHTGNRRRKYRISGLTPQMTKELMFTIDDEKGIKKYVIDYFQETYGYTVRNTTLPCLQVGTSQRPKYLPMEVCKIVEGQCYTKKLSERQRRALVKGACQKPRDREADILQTVRSNAYHNDPYCKEFGIRVSNELALVEARVLPPPMLKYNDTGKVRDCLPQVGQWNMKDKKMVNGGTVNFWAWINFSHDVSENEASIFCKELARMCQVSGMSFSNEPVVIHMARPEHVEKALKYVLHQSSSKIKRKLDLLIAILPDDNGSLYDDLKRICETELDIISQCCLAGHVYRMKPQYLANVALKINVKAGGSNNVLVDALSRRIPLVSDIPTIIFGADVTHPRPGEVSTPSIAAVVASQDWPWVTKYAVAMSAQKHRQEIIQDLFKSWIDPVHGQQKAGMIRELMMSFRQRTGQKPQRIIFYRDGVSEGQFRQVLSYELDAIYKACASLEPDYQPPITFVVVQKRHHTRLFPNNHNDRNSMDGSGNILPGTVVDNKICHPTEFDFYLCSHAGIQGTSRPTHYHVLWDDNNFTADGLQSLTNNLCYTYARCTRSVSIVPPAYYAHHVASRARKYMDSDLSANGSVTSGSHGEGSSGTRPLPEIKENVKKVMFFC